MKFYNISDSFEFIEEAKLVQELMMELKELFENSSNFTLIEKGERDVVTTMDLKVEEIVISKIKSKFPNDMILSEESTNDVKIENRCWVIDPIDGTFNYANNLILYGVQLAFTKDRETYIGGIYLPALAECYMGYKGHGAFLNGNRIQVKKAESISKMMVSLGDFDFRNEERSKLYYAILNEVRRNVMRTRKFGASCVDFGFLASGRLSGYVMPYFFPWDVVPGILLVKEAGGYVTHTDGSDLDFESEKGLVMSNSEEFNDFIVSTYKDCSRSSVD